MSPACHTGANIRLISYHQCHEYKDWYSSKGSLTLLIHNHTDTAWSTAAVLLEQSSIAGLHANATPCFAASPAPAEVQRCNVREHHASTVQLFTVNISTILPRAACTHDLGYDF
jgi:hypothetical protein